MKKNLLKLLTLVLALVMVVTVFAGCKKADEETDAPTQGSEETPTETQEQPADEYKPSAAQLLNGKEWGKDYTELYDEIGDKVTIDDVQEDPTTGLAYVEYEGKTYELGMDFLSMAMVYKTAVPENSQYETEDDVYAAWWKYYMTRWNYLLPEIPLYSNEYYDVYNAQIKGVDEHPTNPYWGPAKALIDWTSEKTDKDIIIGNTTDLSGKFRYSNFGGSNPGASDLDVDNLINGMETVATTKEGGFEVNKTVVKQLDKVENEDGTLTYTITLNDGSIHVLLAPTIQGIYVDYHDALSASKDIFIRGGSVVTETVENTDPSINTFRHRALYSRDGDIVISGGSVQAEGGELYAESGSIRISDGEVKADALCSEKGLTISGGEVTTKGFNVPDPIVLSGDAKVTFDGVLGEGGLSRFDLSGLTTDGYLRYKPDPLDSEDYVVVPGTLEPQPGGDAGNASGDAGGAIAAVVLGSAAVWGGYEVVTRVILNELLPEGAAIPANRGQLALLVWNNAGRPEPAAQPAFADVADADMAKAAQWCAEQGIMEAKSADTFKPEGWTPKFNVIETWNKAFPKH